MLKQRLYTMLLTIRCASLSHAFVQYVTICQETCPVHILGPVMDGASQGDKLFGEVSAASALGILRSALAMLQVPEAESYRTHDLRRGHAQDLVESGK